MDKGKPLPGPGTVVGANVRLSGILKDLNDISIHGQVDGEVISDKNVLITETASVKGPISAKVLTVAGKINGLITVEEKMEILPTGVVQGSITTRDLIIRSGAKFNGKCSMISDIEQGSKNKKDLKSESKSALVEEEKDFAPELE